MILALDIASVTGWAFAPPGAPVPLFGECRMAPVGADEALVFAAFDSWLCDKLDSLEPRYVFGEDQFISRKFTAATTRRLHGLRAICAMECHRRAIRLRWEPNGTVAKFMTGRGSWPKGEKKPATIRACHSYGWRPATDNMADALALWLYAEHQITPLAGNRRGAGVLFARTG